ncbi:pentapeptide repeat-containing protein [Streptomyces sp. IBSBF 2806]|uniref:pentapeptide repeat-containing protein n=1 Tax=Streptomyces sp. IBSBF 2806 TaxID=2903529 RepID=UPI002FDBBD24
MLSALPGLAALGALLFTFMSVEQSRTELGIAEQGQITSRFNAAIEHLGSQSVNVRLGGIYALQRILQDSPRDRSSIVQVLCAYLRQNAHVPASGFDKIKLDDLIYGRKANAASDVQAVISVLSKRPSVHPPEDIDLSATELRFASFSGKFQGAILGDSDLRGASLDETDLRGSYFAGANLEETTLTGANLKGAYFTDAILEFATFYGAKLSGADFSRVHAHEAELGEVGEPVTDLTKAIFAGADLREAYLEKAKLIGAILVDANLNGAFLNSANLRGARLSAADKSLTYELGTEDVGANASLRKAELIGADLRGADLRGVDLSGADLTRADLRGAKLSGVKLDGATLIGTRGLPPSLHP